MIRTNWSAALLASALALAGCSAAEDACNGECPEGTRCEASLLACVPLDFDAGPQPADGGDPGACTRDPDCQDPTKPNCDANTGECVECVANADCQSGQCDAATRRCLGGTCRSNSDCAGRAGRPKCNADGVCVECVASNDCPARGQQLRTCDRNAQKCIDKACGADLDCNLVPTFPSCDKDGGGQCVQCVRDDQCASPNRCDPARKLCVRCLADADCSAARGESCTAEFLCKVTGCASDAACPGNERCDPVARKCVACVGDADCAFGGECVNGACANPASCGEASCVAPAKCVGSACAACVEDADCGAARKCVSGACTEPATCTADAACNAGRACLEGACAPVACAADAHEPNDTTQTATPIDPGEVSGTACPNELDAFVLRLPEGAGASAELLVENGAAVPRLELVVGTGVAATPVVARVVGSRALVTIESVPAGSKALLVRVTGTGAAGVAYRLVTRVREGGLCADDEREPDDTLAQARVVGAGVYSGTLCARPQEDWFAVDVPEGSRPSASLVLRDPATGDVPAQQAAILEIYALRNGTSVRDAYDWWDHAENRASTSASAVAPAGGARYWVHVLNQAYRKFTYDLTLEVRPRPPRNDACDQPTAISASGTITGTTVAAIDHGAASCGGAGGPDAFWSLVLARPSRVRLSLASDFDSVLSLSTSAAGTCEQRELGCARGEGTEALSFDALPAGTYTLRVDAADEREGTFTIGVDVSDARPAPAGETCAAPEPLAFTTDVANVTGSVGLARDDRSSTCGSAGGDAVYALELAEPRRVTATLTGFPGASLTLVSADACGEGEGVACVPAASRGGAWTASLDRAAVPAGRWRLVVDGGGLTFGEYALRVALAEALFPPANDACDGVLELAATQSADTRGADDSVAPTCGGAGHSAGDVVYRFTATETSSIELQLTATFDAAISVTTACDGGAVVACADGDRTSLRIPVLEPGTYYVWVDGYATGRGSFTLTSALRAADPIPANDTCESAQSVDLSGGLVSVSGSTARALDDLAPANCRSAPGAAPLDLDGPDAAYAVTVPAGKSLRATLRPSGYDGAIYVLDACGAATCLGAADRWIQPGLAETITVANTGTSAATWRVVVDSWRPAVSGAFTLDLELL